VSRESAIIVARPKNTVQSEVLRLSVSPEMRIALEKIARTGLSGLNPNEVAVRLIERGLRAVTVEISDTKQTLKKL
jgi:hypothetical protein